MGETLRPPVLGSFIGHHPMCLPSLVTTHDQISQAFPYCFASLHTANCRWNGLRTRLCVHVCVYTCVCVCVCVCVCASWNITSSRCRDIKPLKGEMFCGEHVIKKTINIPRKHTPCQHYMSYTTTTLLNLHLWMLHLRMLHL